MRIYTRTGDDGTTSLFGGQRLGKDALRIEAYGTLDELNANMGSLSAHAVLHASGHLAFLRTLQSDVFTWGSHLATTDPAMVRHLPSVPLTRVDEMERWMDDEQGQLPELTNFLLPGGHPAIADAHVCRVVCRRAERRVIALAQVEPVPEGLLAYLNRLSDVFFVWSRSLHAALQVPEIHWNAQQ